MPHDPATETLDPPRPAKGEIPAKIRDALLSFRLPADQIEPWYHSPKDVFSGKTPAQVVIEQGPQAVLDALEDLRNW